MTVPNLSFSSFPFNSSGVEGEEGRTVDHLPRGDGYSFAVTRASLGTKIQQHRSESAVQRGAPSGCQATKTRHNDRLASVRPLPPSWQVAALRAPGKSVSLSHALSSSSPPPPPPRDDFDLTSHLVGSIGASVAPQSLPTRAPTQRTPSSLSLPPSFLPSLPANPLIISAALI